MALGASSPLAYSFGRTFLKVLLLYLLRFETLAALLFVAFFFFPVSCFAHVNSYGHFLFKVMRFSLSSSKPHLLELLNSEIRNLWVISFTLPRNSCFSQGSYSPMTENFKVVSLKHPKVSFQVLQQNQH